MKVVLNWLAEVWKTLRCHFQRARAAASQFMHPALIFSQNALTSQPAVAWRALIKQNAPKRNKTPYGPCFSVDCGCGLSVAQVKQPSELVLVLISHRRVGKGSSKQ